MKMKYVDSEAELPKSMKTPETRIIGNALVSGGELYVLFEVWRHVHWSVAVICTLYILRSNIKWWVGKDVKI